MTHSRIQQTELSFLLPPKTKTKSRYHNIDILVNWSQNILNYWEHQDFSTISNLFIIDSNTLISLQGQISISSTLKLIQHYGFSTNDLESFREYLLSIAEISSELPLILNAANVGRRRFLESLGWLLDYQTQIETLSAILQVFFQAKDIFIVRGLNPFSIDDFSNSIIDYDDNTNPEVLDAIDLVTDYIQHYTELIPEGKSFPATSDIIESLFARFKNFLKASPFSEINEMILSLVLSTTKITTESTHLAMESLTNNALNNWILSTFGQSILSQRLQAFFNP